MSDGRVTLRVGEAIVLRTWPFLEADLLVSLFTREHGKGERAWRGMRCGAGGGLAGRWSR